MINYAENGNMKIGNEVLPIYQSILSLSYQLKDIYHDYFEMTGGKVVTVIEHMERYCSEK